MNNRTKAVATPGNSIGSSWEQVTIFIVLPGIGRTFSSNPVAFLCAYCSGKQNQLRIPIAIQLILLTMSIFNLLFTHL
jgi:hypothetical protein